MNDQLLLEQLYENIFKKIFKNKTSHEPVQAHNSEPVLIPRRHGADRLQRHHQFILSYIQDYKKNNKIGDIKAIATPLMFLPDNLTVNGNLEISNTLITKFPKNLTVTFDLWAMGLNITDMPSPDLRVGRNLYLYDTPLSKKYSAQEIKNALPHVHNVEC